MKKERLDEFEKVKNIIKEEYEYGDCGIFSTRNWAGDYMTTIFRGKYFTIDICYDYSYFEVFGMTEKEFTALESYYNLLKKVEMRCGW